MALCWERNVFLSLKTSFNSETENWPLFAWTHTSGTVFYPQLLKRDHIWYYWIKAKTDPISAAKFEVTAEIQNPRSGFKMMLIGPVHPIDMTVKEVLKTGHYLHMNNQNIEKLKTTGGDAEKCGYTDQLLLKFNVKDIDI